LSDDADRDEAGKPKRQRPRDAFGWRAWVGGITVFVFALGAFVGFGKLYYTGDSIPYRYLPVAIMAHGNMSLDAWPELGAPEYYAVVRDKTGRLASKKPVLPGILAIPAFALHRAEHDQWPQTFFESGWLLQRTAGVIGAVAAGILAMVLFGMVRPWIAALWSFVFVLGTPFWFTVMDLWPHSILAVANGVSLLCLRKREKPAAWLIIGLLQGAAFATRPGAAIVALVFLGAACVLADSPRERLRQCVLLLGGFLPSLVCVGWYNWAYFGSPWETGFRDQAANRIRWPFAGLLGLYFSPAKGLFVFSPALLIALAAVRKSILCTPLAGVSAVALGVHSVFWACYADWWGGWTWGPRYLAEALPFVIVLAALGTESLIQKRSLRRRIAITGLLVVLIALSCLFQVTGWIEWNGDYHAEFDRGWQEGRGWVWEAPFEVWWRWTRE